MSSEGHEHALYVMRLFTLNGITIDYNSIFHDISTTFIHQKNVNTSRAASEQKIGVSSLIMGGLCSLIANKNNFFWLLLTTEPVLNYSLLFDRNCDLQRSVIFPARDSGALS